MGCCAAYLRLALFLQVSQRLCLQVAKHVGIRLLYAVLHAQWQCIPTGLQPPAQPSRKSSCCVVLRQRSIGLPGFQSCRAQLPDPISAVQTLGLYVSAGLWSCMVLGEGYSCNHQQQEGGGPTAMQLLLKPLKPHPWASLTIR